MSSKQSMHVFAIKRFSVRDSATAGAQLLRRYVVVALTFVVGLTLSFAAFSIARDWEGRRIQADFTQQADERAISIENGLRNLLDPLLSIRGFYAASNSVERDEFTTFINA